MEKIILQLLLVVLCALFLRRVIGNAVTSLAQLHISSGFDFLYMRAGISIPNSLIPYSEDSIYRTALLSGLLNTIFMSLLCIITATLLGSTVAWGRLSDNWLLQKLCLVYVEIFRNLPPLLVILFLYFGILQRMLPPIRNSFVLPFNIYMNQRGIYFPALHWNEGYFLPLIIVLAIVIVSVIIIKVICEKGFISIKWKGLFSYCSFFLLFCPGAFYLIFHYGHLDIPRLQIFNVIGGFNISAEFLALFLALSFYTAALISETIRSGIKGVDDGLKEAGASLGLSSGLIARLITRPIALRIIIPPLASQYMNLVKNTSLAVAIGYSDLMRVGNTILNQTNQSIEVVAIWIVVYLGLCLGISVLMNWFNHKAVFVER